MSEANVDKERRTWIAITCGAGAIGGAAVAVPFVSSFAPSERAKAAGAPVQADISGLRPGEKLFEELLASEEATLPTPHPKLRIALSRAANFDAVGQMVAWCERDRPADDAEVRARLQAWIPEYKPPAGAPVQPIPVVPADAPAPLPLRAPRRR